MRNSKSFRIAPFLLAGLFLILYSCQNDESAFENQLELVGSGEDDDRKNAKIDVCHNGRIINISINAVDAHQRHGDAIDLDGDGYFDIDNSCSETDCDDSDPDKNPGIEGSCDMDPGTAELLIGSWTTTEIAINSFVGSRTLTDYLIEEEGLTPEEAAAQVEMFEDMLIPEITGTLIINEDNTYESAFAGGTDSGTWELSEDEMTLTLFEGADIIVITINSITENTWYATTTDDFLVDLDGDPGTPDVLVTPIANVVFEKD
ncbi:MAG: hypothetical protein ABF293_12815 [Flavobacteriaceae bacterium]